MWLFTHFTKKTAKAALSHRMYTLQENEQWFDGEFSTNCQVVNFDLETYATNDVIVGAEAFIINYKEPNHMSAVG